MDYRVKRARLGQDEMPAMARRGRAEAEYVEPFAPYEPAELADGNPAWANAFGSSATTAEMQTVEESGTPFDTDSASPPMTVSLPQEWLMAGAAAETESPAIPPITDSPLRARPLRRSYAQHTAPGTTPMIARVQRSRSPTTNWVGAVPFAATRPNITDTVSPLLAEHAPTLEMGAATGVYTPARTDEMGMPSNLGRAMAESAARAAAPVWALSFVTAHIARLAASAPDYDYSEEDAPLPATTEFAPMVVRRPALQTPLAHGVPGLPALFSPVRPAGQMLAHVPATELDLGREMPPLVQRSEAVQPQTHESPDASVSRDVRSTHIRRPTGVRPTNAATDVVSPAAEPEPVSSRPAPSVQMLQPEILPTSASVREWPVLPYVQRSSTQEPANAEPPAIQVLRQRGPTAHSNAMSILSALPSLGRGAPLPEEVRRPMETLMRRDLSGVETHESTAAESLGAEAFTSGHRIVFSPGRLDYRSARGLAVVGHELTHVGQPLAFREWSVSSAMDAAENTARQQETQIEQSLSQNWPNAPHMEVLQATQALRSLISRGGAAAAAAGAGGPVDSAGGGATAGAPTDSGAASGGQAAGGAAAGNGGAAAGGGEPAPAARLSEAPAGPASGGAKAGGQNIDQLAHEVYDLIKVRLRGELLRHTLYP